jgi:2-phosphoglycerate kinase
VEVSAWGVRTVPRTAILFQERHLICGTAHLSIPLKLSPESAPSALARTLPSLGRGQTVDDPKVLLIGGAPGVGKTTLGRALAARLGATSLSIDDLLTAAKAVTTPESHPGLHIISAVGHIEYFTSSSVDQLKADATAQHEAAWPAVEKVIRNHATWGSPIVIDGWALRPTKVVLLDLSNVKSVWLVADPSVLREREKQNRDFVRDSPEPDRMLENFLARSIWYNDLIQGQATELRLKTIKQDGATSVEQLCDMVLH